MKTIEFWFEFASTYSYIAAMRFEALTHGLKTHWQPFLLGPIFKAQGWSNSPFNVYPIKGHYMWRDMQRLAEKYDLPFRKPDLFPQNTLLAARIACACQNESFLPDFVRAVYLANFAENKNISDPQLLISILNQLGGEGASLIALAESDQNKQKLKEISQKAESLGIFGAPTFVVGEEVFWGQDRLEDAIEYSKKSN